MMFSRQIKTEEKDIDLMEDLAVHTTRKMKAIVPSPKDEHRKWFGGLQALRGILFLVIFIGHSWQFFPVTGIEAGPAVESFFICSGFLSGYFYDEMKKLSFKDCLTTLYKKLKTFYPFYVIWLIIFAVIMRLWDPANFIKCVFLLQSYFGNAQTALSFNWPCWFLSSIMLSYALAPLLNYICSKVRTKEIYVMLALFTFQLIFTFLWREDGEAYSLGYYYVYIFPPIRVIDYVQGILLAGLFKEKRNRAAELDKNIYNMIEAGILLVLAGEMTLCHLLPEIFRYTAIWAPISAALVWMFAALKGEISRMFTCRFLLWLGGISYELYIIHRLVIIVFSHISTDLSVFVVMFIVTLLLGYAVDCIKKMIRQTGS